MANALRTRDTHPAAAPPQVTNRPRPGAVLIRMYGQGVGDCFLLMFPRVGGPPDQRPFTVLIDCGVVGGTPNGTDRMRQVVEDIRTTTADPTLPIGPDGKAKGRVDLLVITHEHWDHLSGFVQADKVWEQIQVETLWTAWTEKTDPDGFPGVLKDLLAKQRQALTAAADRAFRLGATAQHQVLRALMGFYGDGESDGQGFAAARGVSDALDLAKQLVAPDKRICCEPGEVRALPGTGVVAYVLGPPRNDARLLQLRPKKRAPETYEAPHTTPEGDEGPAVRDPAARLRAMADGRSPFNAFVMPQMPVVTPDERRPLEEDTQVERLREREALERSLPFEASWRVALPQAEAKAAAHPALASYFDPVNQWRRIDADWLDTSTEFALRADALTNNTSLVLAFELPAKAEGAERGVLLFTADAQVGNWLSWDEITAWKPIDGAQGSQQQPNIDDLLKRTVFYKVGHHGSHNATLKAGGVERMRTDAQLTAFVPVSVPIAHKIKRWGQMPLTTLLDALAERAVGRVVLPNGQIWPAQAAPHGHNDIGLLLADATLPVVIKDEQTIENEVPLWIQISLAY